MQPYHRTHSILSGFEFCPGNRRNLNLQETINAALKANLGLKQAEAEVKAAQETKKARTTEFLPTLNSRYSYLRRNEPTSQAIGVAGVGVTDVADQS